MMRLGILPKDAKFNSPIWLHAVSVGEIMAARPLIEGLRILYPETRFFISTVTPTGNKIARGMAKKDDFVAYLPLDISFIVKKVVNKIEPRLFVVMETEIWPNLISCLQKRNVPIIIVNGRISDRSFKGYLSIKFLLKPVLHKINLFCVQTRLDSERLMHLGVLENRIQITGNMKFDVKNISDVAENKSTDFKLRLGIEPREKVLIAASTHQQEEGIILGVYKELLANFPNLKLLIAPRHPERTNEVDKIVMQNGFTPLRVSQLAGLPVSGLKGQTILILDTVGQLLNFYSIADIVFVGGSLIKKGGHNILEPAALGRPVIFGPHMFNFRDIASLFLENKAGILVHNKEELKINIRELLDNPERVAELTQRAKALVIKNQGATQRNLECIRMLLN